MREVKSLAGQGDWCEGDSEDHLINPDCIWCKAIENADGIPFQLIFGPEIGDGHYSNVGAGIKHLLEIEPDELTEKLYLSMVQDFVPLSDDIPTDIKECRNKFLRGEIKSYKARLLLNTPSGNSKWIKDTSIPLRDPESGEIIGAFGILQEAPTNGYKFSALTEQPHDNKQPETIEDTFLSNLSHEIRTPLNAIVGFSNLLTHPDINDKNRAEFTKVITENTDQLLKIFDDITEISNIEAKNVRIKKESVNLNSLCISLYNKFVSAASKKDIILSNKVSRSEDNINIISDGHKLAQVLSSLISNAIKFTNEGIVEFGYSLNADQVEFFVSDTGSGIAPENHSLIFKKFFQVDKTLARFNGGIGLGLTIARAYTILLGGEIRLRSQPGQGSTFSINLPCEKPEQSEGNIVFKLL